MKRLLIVTIVLVFALSLISLACSANLGPETSKTYEFTNFTNVQVGDAFEVEVNPSTSYSVVVTASEDVLERVKIEQSGSTLKITADWGVRFWGLGVHSRPQVKITMPELAILDLSGACKATTRGFTSDNDFKLVLSGASTADIDLKTYDASLSLTGASRVTGNLTVHDIRLNISGASNASLIGSSNDLNVQASGASTADLSALVANDVRVDLSGVSNAQVVPSGSLNVFLSGASRLDYAGNAKLGRVEISGGSTINQS